MRLLLLSTLSYMAMVITAHSAPKNVILLIGDGMGEAEISLARNYEFDGGDGLFIDTMDFRGSAVVNALLDSDPSKLAFVGDSASGGTVLATGQRTAVRRVSTTAKFGVPIEIEQDRDANVPTLRQRICQRKKGGRCHSVTCVFC